MSSRMNDWYIVSNGSRYAPVWPSRDGQGGIRTLDTLAGIPVFETGGFNRSPTCPATRTGWDSNPRNGCPLTRFPSVRLKPLGHPSELLNADAKLIRPREAFYGPPCPGESVGGNRETARCEAPCTVRGARARTSATPQQDPAAVLSRRRRPAAL